ncbi:MAG: hypothetical protein K1X61_02825 [Chitinophagales bacterium]|nr:hypothetical protein [Chitinophagales bacterium]
MQLSARLLSFFFHPLILPTYAFLLICWTNPLLFSNYNDEALSKILLTVFINTFLFPAIAILLIWRLGFVKSLYMETQQERLVPYITSGAMYIWTYVVFRKSGLPEILSIVILGATITLFACFLITIFRKVSIHAAAMACLFILTFAMCLLSQADYSFLLIAIAMLAGIVGSSRLLLGAHDINEVSLGFFIGVMSQLVALKFY